MTSAALVAADDAAVVTNRGGDQRVDFAKQIMPLLQRNCLACHQSNKAEGGLVLESFASLMKGGDSGPAVVAKAHGTSVLWNRASGAEEPLMPPGDNTVGAKPLTPAELDLVKAWIDQGAAAGSDATALPIQWESPAASLQPAYAVAVSGDGRFAAAGRGNQVTLYDQATGETIGVLTDPALSAPATDLDMIQSLAFSPDGRQLATGGFRAVKLWRMTEKSEPIATSAALVDASGHVASSQDAFKVAWRNAIGEIELWDRKADRRIALLRGPADTIADLHMTPGGEQLFAADIAGALVVWDADDGRELMRVETDCGITSMIASDDGTQLAIVDADRHVRLYRVEIAKPSAAMALKAVEYPAVANVADATAIRFAGGSSPSLLIATEAGKVLVVASQSGKLVGTLDQGSAVVQLALSPDASRVAVASRDGQTHVWTIATGKKGITLPIHASLGHPINLARRNLARLDSGVARETARRTELETFAANEATAQQKVQTERDQAAASLAADQTKLADAAAVVKSSQELIDKTQLDIATAKNMLEAAQKMAADSTARLSEQQGLLAMQKAAHSAADAEKKTADASAEAITAAEARITETASAMVTLEAAIAAEMAALQAAQAQVGLATKAVQDATAKLALSNAELEKQKAASKEAAGNRQKSDELLAKKEKALDNSRQATERANATLPIQSRLVALYARRAAHGKLQLHELEQHALSEQSPLTAIVMNDDRIATAHRDGSVCLFRMVDGAWMNRIPAIAGATIKDRIVDLLPLGDDSVLVVRGSGAPLILSVVPDWRLERVIGGPESALISDRVTAIDFRPDGLSLAVGSGEPSRSGDVKFFSCSSGELIKDLGRVHSDSVLGLRFSPDGSQLASSSADRTIRILNSMTGEVERTLEGHTHHVLALAWQDAGVELATAGADQTVKVWDPASGSQRRTITGFPKEVTSISFLSNTTQILTTCADGNLRIHESTNGSLLRTMSAGSDFLHSSATPLDGLTILAGGQSGQLRVWSSKDGQLLKEIK